MAGVGVALAMILAACGTEDSALDGRTEIEPAIPASMSFEDFLAEVYVEPWENGVYIYNGDTPALDMDELRDIYVEMVVTGGLAVNRVNNRDDRWSASQKTNLAYCVSDAFGSRKAAVVSAMATAAVNWEATAVVDLHYRPAEDANCTAANSRVTFDVRPVSGVPYLARAFFPSFPRSSRNILIAAAAFTNSISLTGIMRHELGHVLGFRHEHTRPEARRCFEDNRWRGLTLYDRGSVMHYPQCGGSNSRYDSLSVADREGSSQLYGSRIVRAPRHPPGCGRMDAGYGLGQDRFVQSCDGRFKFAMQSDGNVVLYWGTRALWDSKTSNQPGYAIFMQSDGNLVLRSGTQRPIWYTGTHNNPGAWLAVQDDGNVVIYRNGRPLWATHTGGH